MDPSPQCCRHRNTQTPAEKRGLPHPGATDVCHLWIGHCCQFLAICVHQQRPHRNASGGAVGLAGSLGFLLPYLSFMDWSLLSVPGRCLLFMDWSLLSVPGNMCPPAMPPYKCQWRGCGVGWEPGFLAPLSPAT